MFSSRCPPWKYPSLWLFSLVYYTEISSSISYRIWSVYALFPLVGTLSKHRIRVVEMREKGYVGNIIDPSGFFQLVSC